MQRNFRICLMLAVTMLSLFACNKTRRSKEKTAKQNASAIWSQIPSDTFFAMALHRPAQTGPNFREALTKMGLFNDFYKDAEIEDFQRDLGIDPFKPETMQAIGVDVSKGMAIAADSKLLTTNSYYDSYAAMLRTYKDPAFYGVAALSDPGKFYTWLQDSVAKQGHYQIASETMGDAEVTMMMAKPYSDDIKARTEIIFAVRKGYVYAFFVNLQTSNQAQVPDAIAEFKKQLPGFFARLATPLNTQGSFQKVASQLNTSGDCLLYFDVATLASQYAAIDAQEVIYLTPTTDDAMRYQEQEKQYNESRRESEASEFALIKRLAEAYPAMGMSGAIEKNKLSCEGYSMVGAAYQDDTKAVLMPNAAAPSYATIFPAGTGFIYRESFNLLALKKLVFRFFSQDEQAEMNQDWDDMSREIQRDIGLDLDKDLLGALTGHFAFGAPDLSTSFFSAFLLVGNDLSSIAPNVMILQLTSHEAGETIINALQPMLDAVGVMSENVQGEKMYSFNLEGVEYSWANVDDMMLVALSPRSLKEMILNVRKPGLSIADKLPNELAKSLVTDKNATGCTADMGAYFSSISKIISQNGDSEAAAMLYQLAASVGSSTMKITYENNGVQCRGDLLLK